jgi:hypothetical protein
MGDGSSVPFSKSYTKLFYEIFPFYLSIGMTPEQYWDGDATLARYYRKAEELRRKRKNEELWLQGMYIYEALCDVSPVLNAFAKKGTKPNPYSDHPYSITNKEREAEKERRVMREREKAKQYMLGKMAKLNKRFESK